MYIVVSIQQQYLKSSKFGFCMEVAAVERLNIKLNSEAGSQEKMSVRER